jgi:LAGLIDADG-like domain
MSLLRSLLIGAGVDPASETRASSAGKFLSAEGVWGGPEFDRISALPRRRWQDAADLDELTALMTEWLLKPGGSGKLFPFQAAALRELADLRRLGVVASVGAGKAQPVTEPVLTPFGWCPIGDLSPGDYVIGSNGAPTLVTGVFPQGQKRVTRLLFTDGGSARSCDEHLWTFLRGNVRVQTKSLAEWKKVRLRSNNKWKARQVFAPMLSGPVQYADSGVPPLDPYTLGALLGDGGMTQTTCSFTSMDDDIVARLKLPEGVKLIANSHQNSGKATQYRLTRGTLNHGHTENPLNAVLRELKLAGHSSLTKFVPDVYKYGSPEVRLATLQGLFDTDGGHAKASLEYSSSSKRLALDVQETVYSLGGTATMHIHPTQCADNWRLLIKLPDGMPEFLCERKARVVQRQRPPYRALDGFEDAGEAECVCISVAAEDHLYVTNDFLLTHNTLITALAPTVLEAKRPLFLTYAKLLDKTRREFRELAVNWRVANNYQFLGFEKFSRVESAQFLDKYLPDMIVADEAHAFKTPASGRKTSASGRTKRLGRWLKAHPECVFIPLTGTPGDESVHNIAHIQNWVHREHSPLPRDYNELNQWAQCLDAKVTQRRSPGVLKAFAKDSSLLDDVRAGVGDRVAETPGNLYQRNASVQCSLYLDSIKFDDYPEKVEQNFACVRKDTDHTPDGRVLDSPVELWRLFNTMSLGFWHLLDPAPPEAWREARKMYNSFVRDILSQSKYGLDTPLQVGQLCRRGEIDSQGLYAAWKAIEPTFKPNPIVEWFDDSALKYCSEWLTEHQGLLWTSYPAFGKKLAEMSGRPFYHLQGIDAKTGKSIEEHGDTSCILALMANKEGRNLQRFHKNLVVTPSASSDVLEQMIGRTHRQGQTAEAVEVSFLLGSIENLEALYKARNRAKFDRDQGKNLSSKLLTGDWMVHQLVDSEAWDGPRWQK